MKFKTILPLVLGISLYLVSAAHAETQAESYALIQAGQKLTETEVSDLEANLGRLPADLTVRTKLLGYYWQKQSQPKAREARQKHVLWIIQNQPEGRVAGQPYGALDKFLDGKAYEDGKALWMQQVETHKTNAIVLGNAAAYLVLHDRELAENSLIRASKQDPENPIWHDRLGDLHRLNNKEAVNTNGLASFETAQQLDTNKTTRFYRLSSLCQAALRAGQTDKAAGYATQLLEQVAENTGKWDVSTAVHVGNLTLGHVALRNGQLKEAKEYLLKAGTTTGSPALNSFGPNMSLAKALLEKEEKEVVLEYFDLCRKFWKDEKLNHWTAEVKAGKVPDFGANLRY